MRVLVTGHKGYIGTVLVPLLMGEGHIVKGLDSNLFEECTFGGPAREIPCLAKDIRDIRVSDLEGFEAVVHLAGLSNDPLGNLNPALTYEINHRAAVRMATLAKKAGVVRFLFSSSCSNYGAAGNGLLNEDAELCPVTPYARSKILVEQDIAKLADPHFSPTFLRCGTVFGVSPSLRFDLVLNNLVAWAFTTGRVYIKSDGTPWRPIVHVEDISHAFAKVLQAPRDIVHNQAFNVGQNKENYQIMVLAEIVKETVPGSQIEYAGDAGPDKRSYRVDFSKLAKFIPEFKPKWNARRGARQLHEAFMETGLCLEDFEGPRYKRIEHIKMLLDKGARVNDVNLGDEVTPLHLACYLGYHDIVELLVARGANVNFYSFKFSTPLHLAVANGHLNTIKLLLKHGARKDVKDDLGNTPREIAELFKSPRDVVDLLSWKYPL